MHGTQSLRSDIKEERVAAKERNRGRGMREEDESTGAYRRSFVGYAAFLACHRLSVNREIDGERCFWKRRGERLMGKRDEERWRGKRIAKKG